MITRAFPLASLMIGLACGPQASLDFSGVYSTTSAYESCRIEHPLASSASATYIGGDDVLIDADGTGIFPLELPRPPCGIVGRIEHDRILLSIDDCVVEHESIGAEEYAIEYSDGHGIGRWEDEGLELRIEMARRYTSVPSGFVDWWDDPGRCLWTYTLEPLEQP
jgi:hypothetical protein